MAYFGITGFQVPSQPLLTSDLSLLNGKGDNKIKGPQASYIQPINAHHGSLWNLQWRQKNQVRSYNKI